jgi:hypothetical protein
VSFSTELDDDGARWRFYVSKHHREERLGRTTYFSPDAVPSGDVARDSLAVLYPNAGAFVRTGAWSQVAGHF